MSEEKKVVLRRQLDSVPLRMEKETDEEYIVKLIATILKLDNIIDGMHQEYVSVVNEDNIVPRAYADEVNRKYHCLMTVLKGYGLYVGQEL